ncbi:hypothetical protein [uncultured Ilyobacter sp.]|uniref:hypothetical protein n=1 Tax=uncultured Ilyobacter sp. TaxID=544433 RepID=UPI0029BFDD22|nr:hypothetical protein [uncultured Ilyobacter sp.]
MAKFSQETVSLAADIKRMAPDMRVTLGAADVTIEPFQALAQSAADGKFYKYVKGDTNLGTIAGIYTGEEVTLTAAGDDQLGSITTMAIVGKDDIVGVDFDTDYSAILQFKQCGIVLTDTMPEVEEV